MQNVLPWFGLAVRLFMGYTFVEAALPKIVEPLPFATSIGHYGILPSWGVHAFALVLPWLELACAALLIAGYRTRLASILGSAMMLAFAGAVAWAVAHALEIDCGCFGEGVVEKVSWAKVGKNTAMAAALLVLARFPTTPWSADAAGARS